MMHAYLISMLLLFGLCLGSFVNAAVWRLKVRKDIVKDRSECIHCHHKLTGKDLVPLFSWLALRGKCRYCHKSISPQYPLVEAALAIYFVGSYLLWPYALTGVYAWFDFGLWLIYGVMLAILFVYDLRWQLLPDRIVKPLIVLGAVDFVATALAQHWSIQTFLANLALSLLAISGFYGALYAYSKGAWVGFGDVKLGAFMGLALGWQTALFTLFAANLLGLLIIIPGMALKRLSRTSKIPFGPFLIAAFVIAGLFGVRLVNSYLESIGLFSATLML